MEMKQKCCYYCYTIPRAYYKTIETMIIVAVFSLFFLFYPCADACSVDNNEYFKLEHIKW